MSLVIREAAASELEEVGDLTVKSYTEYAERLGPERWAEYSSELRDNRGKLENGATIFVAEVDGEKAGAVGLFKRSPADRPWPRDWTLIRALAVLPAYRDQGVGKALVEKCIEQSREWKAPAVFLRTVDYMKAAVNMYERMGFKRADEYCEVIPSGRELLGYVMEL